MAGQMPKNLDEVSTEILGDAVAENDLIKRRAEARPVEAEGRNKLERLHLTIRPIDFLRSGAGGE